MADEKKRNFGFLGGVAAGILALLLAVLVIGWLGGRKAHSRGDSSGEGPSSLDAQMAGQRSLVQRRVHIFFGQYSIAPGRAIEERFKISPRMLNPRVAGTFRAFGGSGNDIEAVLMDSFDFTNWANGHSAQAYYSTPGRETAGRVSTGILQPGSYVFAFDNRFSAFSQKQVTAEIDLIFNEYE